MPEGPEICLLSQYLSTVLRGKILLKLVILSGKYATNPFNNAHLLDGSNNYVIKDVNSKGKLIYFELEHVITKKIIYLTSHLGLSGFWTINPTTDKSWRILINISDDIMLFYQDDRNFGNINVYDDYALFMDKINTLAPDIVKTNINTNDLLSIFTEYINNTKKDPYIVNLLMDQNAIVSGIGNYLMAEILYNAKISPFRKLKSLSKEEILTLSMSIKYIVKLAYYNNSTGYMTQFDKVFVNGKYIDFVEYHKQNIGVLYPNYHQDIILNTNDKFIFEVYGKKIDKYGHKVEADKTLQKGRSTYWTPTVQI
jgi:formamidopyrimidine-DNA glycosylase